MRFAGLSIRMRLRILAALFAVAFLALGAVTLATLETVKVNGPIYRTIAQGKDLIADVLPPPQYIIESYLLCLRLLQEPGTGEVDLFERRLVALRDHYLERQDFWESELPGGPLRESMVVRSRAPAERFYAAVFADLLPAARSGDRERAFRSVKATLEPAYEEHRRAVDEVVALAATRNSAGESRSSGIIAHRSRILALLFLAVALIFGALSALTLEGVAASHAELERRVEERTADLRALAAVLSNTEERERRAIASDLHDRIGQTLALARMKLASLGKGAPSGADSAVAECRGLLEGAIADTRSLLVELAPPAFHELSLGDALGWLCDEVGRRYGLDVEQEIDAGLPPADPETRIALLKGARELLVNSAKHSGAGRAALLAVSQGGAIEIVVADAGVGCDPACVTQGPSRSGGRFGLFSLRERLARIGGTLAIETAPGRGTRAAIRIPPPPPVA